MENTEQAVVDWLHTFEAGQGCNNLEQLGNGAIIVNILHEICPTHFDPSEINHDTADNWALAASNIRTVNRMLDEYFKTVVGKQVDVESVDVNEIAKNHNVDEILNLLELVVGVAVMCEDKNEFIRNIFELNSDSQAVLKELVERVLERAVDISDHVEAVDPHQDVDEEEPLQHNEKHAGNNEATEEELIRKNEMLAHLQSERQSLLNEVRTLEKANDGLKTEVARLKEKSSLSEQERHAIDGGDKLRSEAAESHNMKLQREVDELKRELDLKLVETDNVKAELRSTVQRLEASREIQAKLEMENHHQADELDLARDKLAKLAKAEQSVERYQKKLEEMMSVKKQNKELTEKMDQYLDKIHDLESTNKSLSNTSRMIEQYKNRAVELEREKFEAISTSHIYEQQVQQLSADSQKEREIKHKLQDEIDNLRTQMQISPEADEALNSSGLDLEEIEVDTVPKLREKVKTLERQLKSLAADRDTPSDDAGSSSSEVLMLKQELDELRLIKKEREDALVDAKRKNLEKEHEISKLRRSLEESAQNAESSQALKDIQHKFAAASSTINMLQEKLKEKETNIHRLERDKEKLENYAKRSLGTFKDKFMTVLQNLRDEKRDLEQKIRMQAEKAEKNQETWRREERLLSSALFEVGVKIMDRKIQSQLSDSLHPQSNSFLGVQRDSMTKAGVDSAMKSPVSSGEVRKPSMTPGTPFASKQ